MIVAIQIVTGLILGGLLVDFAIRRRLRRLPEGQVETRGYLRALIWSMRVRALSFLSLLILFPAALVQTSHARWAIVGAMTAVILPLVGVMLWFNVGISRELRRKVR
jgi:hypothetical protein